jgi:AraC-like DNA-binding protein
MPGKRRSPLAEAPMAIPVWMTAYASRVSAGSQYRGSRHTWVLGMVLSGFCEHGRPDGPRIPLVAGDVVGISPETPQFWRVTGSQDWEVISVIFTPRPHWLPWLAWTERSPGFMVHHPAPDHEVVVREAFQRAVHWSASGRSDAADRAGHAIESVLLECSHWCLDRARLDVRIQRVVDALTEDLARPNTLGRMVALSGYSRAQFLRRFQREVGMSPMAYLSKLRREGAQQLLLHSDLAVKTIATMVGIPDSGYFCRMFHQACGMPPLRYRLQSRQV